MPKVIHIRTTGDLTRFSRSLLRIRTRLPEMTRGGMRKWGQMLEKDMKSAAMDAGIRRHTGLLFSEGIQWRQGKRSDHGHLFIRLYGIYLSEMTPHYVTVHRRRIRILMWARHARNPSIRRQAEEVSSGVRKAFTIFVRNHPFIRTGYRRARPKLNPILKSRARRAIQTM